MCATMTRAALETWGHSGPSGFPKFWSRTCFQSVPESKSRQFTCGFTHERSFAFCSLPPPGFWHARPLGSIWVVFARCFKRFQALSPPSWRSCRYPPPGGAHAPLLPHNWGREPLRGINRALQCAHIMQEDRPQHQRARACKQARRAGPIILVHGDEQPQCLRSKEPSGRKSTSSVDYLPTPRRAADRLRLLLANGHLGSAAQLCCFLR